MTPSRRQYLTSVLGGLGALAGCVDADDPGAARGSDPEPTEDSDSDPAEDSDSGPADDPTASANADPAGDGTEAPEPDARGPEGVSVADVVVRKAIRYDGWGSSGVFADRAYQYVVAAIDAEYEVAGDEFSFETRGASWSPHRPNTHALRVEHVAGIEGWPLGEEDTASGRLLLVFQLPPRLRATDPRIVYRGESTGAWRLPVSERERLAEPPARFELQEFSVPQTVTQYVRDAENEEHRTVTASLSARNVSDVDGRFLAAVHWPTIVIHDDDEAHIVERTVAAGEEVSAEVEIPTHGTANDDRSVTVHVEGHVEADRQVDVHVPEEPLQ